MKVFVFESYHVNALARLRADKNIELLSADREQEAEVALVRSRTRVDGEFLKKHPCLKAVFTATSGFDHIDWRTLNQAGVISAFTPEANAQSTAELTLFLMISLLRRLPRAQKNVREGHWREHLNRGLSLEDKTLGVVGMGRVGGKVVHLARAFGMSVQGHDPYISEDRFQELDVPRLGFIELLRTSDIVTFHVPLTQETKHMINHATLKEMMTTSFVINASRGAVVDESELLVALKNDMIAGAALDVMEKEPPVSDNALLRLPNVVVTPHVGAHTEQAWERSSSGAVNRLFLYMQGKSIPDTLPLETLWFERA